MADAELKAKITLEYKEYERAAKQVSDQAKQMEQDFGKAEKAADGLGYQLGKMAGGAAAAGLNGIKTAAKMAGAALAAAAVSAGGLFAAVASEAADAQRILQDASRLNMDTSSFQAYTYAAAKFNIEGDKAADILKDVNDKMGDFILTGGGEAKDIFEQLHLDAKDFIGLSPDKALQKIADAAQGLSAQDKTFLFEAIADDASLLIPLLDEGGKKLQEFKSHAIDKGMILSPEELQYLSEFKSGLSEITEMVKAFAQHAAAYMAGPLGVILDEVNKLLEGFGGMDDAAMRFAETAVSGIGWIIQAAADVYSWFLKWQIVLLDLKASVYALAEGMANLIQVTLKYNPAGIAADMASNGNLSRNIQAFQSDMQGVLAGLSEERSAAESAIAKSQAQAQKLSAEMVDKMRESLVRAQTDLQKNKESGYAAKAPETGARSIAEYEAKQIKAAQEAAAKEAKTAAKEQSDAARKLSAAADHLGGTDVEKRARASLDETVAKLKEQAEAYRQREDERMAQPQRVRYGELTEPFSAARTAAAVNPAAHQANLDALRAMQQSAQEQTAAAQTAQTAAAQQLQAAQTTEAAAQAMQAASLSKAAETTAAASPAAKQFNLTIGGTIGINLSGNSDSLAQGVLSSERFKAEFGKIFETQLRNVLQDVARSVAA